MLRYVDVSEVEIGRVGQGERRGAVPIHEVSACILTVPYALSMIFHALTPKPHSAARVSV
jgi:hypothetical protein